MISKPHLEHEPDVAEPQVQRQPGIADAILRVDRLRWVIRSYAVRHDRIPWPGVEAVATLAAGRPAAAGPGV